MQTAKSKYKRSYLGDGLLEAGLGLLPLRQMHLADGQAVQQHRRGAVLLNQLVVDVGSLLRLAPALFRMISALCAVCKTVSGNEKVEESNMDGWNIGK